MAAEHRSDIRFEMCLLEPSEVVPVPCSRAGQGASNLHVLRCGMKPEQHVVPHVDTGKTTSLLTDRWPPGPACWGGPLPPTGTSGNRSGATCRLGGLALFYCGHHYTFHPVLDHRQTDGRYTPRHHSSLCNTNPNTEGGASYRLLLGTEPT